MITELFLQCDVCQCVEFVAYKLAPSLVYHWILKNNQGYLALVSMVHSLIMINVPFISRSSPGTTRTSILSLWIWM